MKRKYLSLLGVSGLLTSAVFVLTFPSLLHYLIKPFLLKDCMSFFSLCKNNLFPFYFPLLFSLIILGTLNGLLRLALTSTWNKVSVKEKLSPKLRRAIFLASTYQPEIKNISLRFLEKPGFTACTIGFKRPAIILNPQIVQKLEVSEISALLLHEYAHIKQKDNLIFPLTFLLSSSLFFLPLAHFFHHLIIKGREGEADFLVSKWIGNPLPLAESLLKVARLSSSSPLSSAAFLKKQLSLKERIEELFSEKLIFPFKKFLLSLLLTILLLVVAVFPLLASSNNNKTLPCQISSKQVTTTCCR